VRGFALARSKLGTRVLCESPLLEEGGQGERKTPTPAKGSALHLRRSYRWPVLVRVRSGDALLQDAQGSHDRAPRRLSIRRPRGFKFLIFSEAILFQE
jgi:hypothetical protein